VVAWVLKCGNRSPNLPSVHEHRPLTGFSHIRDASLMFSQWQWPSNRRPFVNLYGILMLLPCEQRMRNRIILLGKHEDER
jgi:hypothetical protein